MTDPIPEDPTQAPAPEDAPTKPVPEPPPPKGYAWNERRPEPPKKESP